MACLPQIAAGSDSFVMSYERLKPSQASPSVIDRILLARSIGRHFDGIWIGTWRGTPEDLAPVERALLLVEAAQSLGLRTYHPQPGSNLGIPAAARSWRIQGLTQRLSPRRAIRRGPGNEY